MRLFDKDLYTGITEHVDIRDGKIIIKSSQNIDATLAQNNVDRDISGASWKGDMHHVARIDNVIIEHWCNELKAKGHHDFNILSKENKKLFIAKLNDYNNSKLRTKTGRI